MARGQRGRRVGNRSPDKAVNRAGPTVSASGSTPSSLPLTLQVSSAPFPSQPTAPPSTQTATPETIFTCVIHSSPAC